MKKFLAMVLSFLLILATLFTVTAVVSTDESSNLTLNTLNGPGDLTLRTYKTVSDFEETTVPNDTVFVASNITKEISNELEKIVMTRAEYNLQVKKALEYYEKAKIVLTDKEKQNIEVADFGLGKVNEIGLQLLVYINTERVCAKEMVLLPYQTCPEHKHIPSYNCDGKEETFRCRYGEVCLYVQGEKNVDEIKGKIPSSNVTVFHEVVLKAGEQYTIMPETLHWFQAGENGAVVSEFSTRSTDETDVFTDENIVRETKIED